MTEIEKAIRDFCGHHADWWPSTTQVQEMLALAQPEQEPVAYDKTEMNCFVQDLYDKKMQEGKHGHYETMFHVVHQAIKKVPPQRKPLTDEHPLVVFAKECVLGAYKESELGDAARRAIEAAYNIKGKP